MTIYGHICGPAYGHIWVYIYIYVHILSYICSYFTIYIYKETKRHSNKTTTRKQNDTQTAPHVAHAPGVFILHTCMAWRFFYLFIHAGARDTCMSQETERTFDSHFARMTNKESHAAARCPRMSNM